MYINVLIYKVGDKVLFKNKIGVKIDTDIYGYIISYKQYRDLKINNILNGL